jgi:hypothetical protein
VSGSGWFAEPGCARGGRVRAASSRVRAATSGVRAASPQDLPEPSQALLGAWQGTLTTSVSTEFSLAKSPSAC